MLLALLLWQSVTLRGPQGSVTLHDVAAGGLQFEIDVVHSKMAFTAHGNPARLDAPEGGLHIASSTISGAGLSDGHGGNVLQSAHLEGNAVLTIDLAKARQARQQDALGFDRDVAVLKTAALDYAFGDPVGVATLPAPFSYTQETAGKGTRTDQGQTVPFTFSQILRLGGRSGTLGLAPLGSNAVENPLRTGTIEGPVDLSIERRETPNGAAAPLLSTTVGRADHVRIDLAGAERTIVATGHVTLTTTGTTNTETRDVDTLIITLDERLQPVRIRTSGSPAVTSIRTGGGR